MEPVVLDQIKFQANISVIADQLRIKAGSGNEKLLTGLFDQALAVARPKAMYRIAPVACLSDDRVQIGAEVFTSRVMWVNLQDSHRVFLYVATCGMELEEWARGLGDTLAQYFADVINASALDAARAALSEHLRQNFNLVESSSMNPGSLNDWPINAQTQLFSLLGDPEALIGVRLLDSCLMQPGQSVSGLRFETSSGFVNCQLCPMEDCPHRKAPYNAALFAEKYQG